MTALFSIYVGILCVVFGLVNSEDAFAMEKIVQSGLDFKDIVARVNSTLVTNESTGCINQISALLNSDQMTLKRMADAWSKFPYSGASYYASKSDAGNYDECIKISTTIDNERILGKYCSWGFAIPISNGTQVYLLATCIPDQCSAADLANITRLPLFVDNYCSTQDTDSKLDAGAVIVLVLFALLFTCTILETAYDIFLEYAGKKPPHAIYTAFSMYSNGKKLLKSTKYSKAGEQVLCFHGMKFISMWWIISGHGAISMFLAPALDYEFRSHWQTQRYAQYIASAHICVDTFFYISGFLMAYLYFKQSISKKSATKQAGSVPMMIIHRYLRLTPANAMCFLGSVFLFKYLQTGPFFSFGIHDGLIRPCKKYWWTYFLYIQNYYNFHYGESLCIPTTWYLSADFQLFLITPLVFIPISLIYRRSFAKTMAALAGVNLICLVTPIFIKLQWRDYDVDFQEYDFHSKLISYFIGVMTGIYMRHHKNKKVTINRMVNLTIWFLALGNMLAVIFYRQDIQIKNEYVARSLCYSFTRPMWCISLAWITYACVNGYGGVVNWFLSSPFMQIGGKLTYSLYLTHGMVIAHYALGIRTRIDFTDWNLFYTNCGHFIVSMMVATFWSLSYESPMITLERLIFNRSKAESKPKSKPSKVDQNGSKE
ncbi:nose resistant to fluoxetine protein 6 [Dendroctonus ponderosae]|uniref:Nose resistant-to-fluoxetine protein N-terminal domain-containing protein n=1 Tax=Dendroctonus ponderosae TaxID=77166 RepID=U4UMQ5_DENPD|nr:nose resistant to fluoxetine protein 6 [Dendroctonus ponderosae]ERL94392.1 hypothetical protein D910_11671 [Dendroctonus ponderosae]